MAISSTLVLGTSLLSTGLIWMLFYWLHGRHTRNVAGQGPIQEALVADLISRELQSATGPQAEQVGAFYDATNAAFVQVYGEVIQAFRTRDLAKLLDYQAQMMQLQPGQKLLDAGCGVCGPAVFFAANYGVTIDAITASAVQQAAAQARIAQANLADKVKVVQGDYHQLTQHFPSNHYDVVYFLESFGHSPNKSNAIAAAWTALKPGGLLYIKDLFTKEALLPDHVAELQRNVDRINEAYRYNVSDLYEVIAALRKQGFILSALKTIDIPLEDFENLTISNDFQELTGIHRIDNLQEYLFPVDFFEIVCLKPWYDLSQGNSRYFLQNLYYLRVTGKAL